MIAGLTAVALLTLFTFGAGGPVGAQHPAVGAAPVPDPVVVGTLTSGSGQHFEYSGTTRQLTARAPADNSDGNIREVFWQAGSPRRSDQQVCAVWDDTAQSEGSPHNNRQMGLALRIAPATDDGRGIKAITLTQNIYGGATWKFWVDVWKVTDPAHPNFRGVQQFDLLPVVGHGASEIPPPWHVCAQVQGLTFRFKMWSETEAEPPWHDETGVFSTPLPTGWDYPGRAGGYVGHLWAAQTASFANLRTRSLPSPAVPPSPPESHSLAPTASPALGWPASVSGEPWQRTLSPSRSKCPRHIGPLTFEFTNATMRSTFKRVREVL